MRYLPILLTLSLGLAACATPRDAYFQHGEEKTLDEYLQAEADCERQVGGRDYLTALDVCMRQAGWRATVVYE